MKKKSMDKIHIILVLVGIICVSECVRIFDAHKILYYFIESFRTRTIQSGIYRSIYL